MPKIIENLQERLIKETQKQIKELGYSAVTIRSVAKSCEVGIGTVYNYFPSKESMIASYLLDDWKNCILQIEEISKTAANPEVVARCIHTQLLQYSDRHKSIFQDTSARSSFQSSFTNYHSLLRSQLAKPLEKFCDDNFTSEFIAESLLTWSLAGKSFDKIWNIIKNCF